MEDKFRYWIWLQCCLGAGNKKLRPAVEFFKNAENIYFANETDYRLLGIFSETEITKLCDKNLGYAEKTVKLCEKLGYGIVPFTSAYYPRRLSEIPTPPVVLYILGNLPAEDTFHVGMVGTRNAGETGTLLSYNFAYDLAKSNVVTVSGGAYGVDISAHRGSIDAGGVTVCIIGCGINMLKTKIGKYLLEEVPRKGAVVSEYPPLYPATKFTFPMRDRIISGLSDCTLIVRAGLGSGALITAKYAIEQGRKIFAVPGEAANIDATGVNYMIKNGFSAALSCNDILDWYANGGDMNKQANPAVGAEFMRTLAVKPENVPLIHTDKRACNIPGGYRVMSSLYKSIRDDFSGDPRQMKLDEKNETGFEIRTGEGSDTAEERKQTEVYDEQQREKEIKYMNELLRRHNNNEPEPPSSPIKRNRDSQKSEEYLRVMEIDRIIKKYNLGRGIDYDVGKRMLMRVLSALTPGDAMKVLQKAPENLRNEILALKTEGEKREKEDEIASVIPRKSKSSKEINNSNKKYNMGMSDKKTALKKQKGSKISENEEKNKKILPE